MYFTGDIVHADGLTAEAGEKLQELVSVFEYHRAKNDKKNKYYEGHVQLADVNLGIALPKTLRGFEIGCEWGAKCVDVLASRSMFDGFVGAGGEMRRPSRILRNTIT